MSVQTPGQVQRIAISNQKGGVAKTTTCLSLGASLAEQNLRVLLVDLDPQAHLTQALSVDPDGLRRTVGDALLNQATVLEVSKGNSTLAIALGIILLSITIVLVWVITSIQQGSLMSEPVRVAKVLFSRFRKESPS